MSRRIRDSRTGRTGRTRTHHLDGDSGPGLGAEHGPCSDPRQGGGGGWTGRTFTTVTWDDGTKDNVHTDTLDGA
ncbi:hypothetical protein [Candidatus Frankia nodulisporulans]|uniref:hypothetical protein n=1 Tax=Candidatus Frankia nodulisporulans TaxID=2060052 RepID=UPI0013D3F9FD|nr:hypothetical protein [Candidatus Frankia nodulisporulans]